MDKKCRKCGVVKNVERDFYPHPKMADGHLNMCKECSKAQATLYRDTFIEKVRDYDRQRGSSEERREARQKYSQTPQGIAARDRARAAWAERNKDKIVEARKTPKAKELSRGRNNKWREHNRARYRELSRVNRARWVEQNPEKAKEIARKYETHRTPRSPEKVKARAAVASALKSGTISRTPCEVCGVGKVHGHHDDYSKPLEVRWLCTKHHGHTRRK